MAKKLNDLIIDYALLAGLQDVPPDVVQEQALKEAIQCRNWSTKFEGSLRKMRSKYQTVKPDGSEAGQ